MPYADKARHAERELARYHEKMAFYRWLLGGRCSACGALEALHIDHIDPATKAFTIGQKWSLAIEVVVAELAKCQLLCDACHLTKSRTNGELRGGQNYVADPPHGSALRYNREGCRCKVCRRWKRDYRAGLVDSRGRSR